MSFRRRSRVQNQSWTRPKSHLIEVNTLSSHQILIMVFSRSADCKPDRIIVRSFTNVLRMTARPRKLWLDLTRYRRLSSSWTVLLQRYDMILTDIVFFVDRWTNINAATKRLHTCSTTKKYQNIMAPAPSIIPLIPYSRAYVCPSRDCKRKAKKMLKPNKERKKEIGNRSR